MSTSTPSPFVEYALRNRSFILDVVKKYIFKASEVNGKVLAVAEGTGAHSAIFADSFKNVTFIPSEYDQEKLDTLDKNLNEWKNVKKAIQIDASKPENWNLEAESFDMITCINMIHISPWDCTIGLLKGVQTCLKADGWLITYGPYAFDGKLTPESNVEFDRSLKARNALWGIRDVVDIEKCANENGLILKHQVKMPANNFCLLFQKAETSDNAKI